MPSQRLIFTALPAGLSDDGRDLLVNLHVAPRLTVTGGGEAPLSDWPAIAGMAATMNGARVTVTVDGTEYAARRLNEADPELWTALFPADTLVRTRRIEDFTAKKLLSYPLAALAEMIGNDYLTLAAAGSEMMPFDKLRATANYKPTRGIGIREALDMLAQPDDGSWKKDRSDAVALLAAYHRLLNAEKIVSVTKRDDKDPHEPTKYRTYERAPMPTPEELSKAMDFHQRVSAMGQHAALMQRCGLVIPLRLSGGGQLAKGAHLLAASVAWDKGGVETDPDVLPRSRIERTASGVVMAAATSLVVDGWLAVNDEKFSLVAMDVDGAGISLKNMAASRVGPDDERFDDDDDPANHRPKPYVAGAPRIRTAGLQLAYDRRDRALGTLFERSKAMEKALADGDAITLSAEDVTRGWRVEIAANGGTWQSLMRFDGSYRLLATGGAVATSDEEAIIRVSAGGSTDGNAPDVMKMTEAMFAWSGWSLAAPEPGKGIMPDDITLAEGPGEVPPGLPLETSFRATARSLPVLRFGTRYQVRLRLADVAGGGLGFDPAARAPTRAETAPFDFGRYEPVETPVLTLLQGGDDPADGESMGRAALRLMDDPARTVKSVHRLIAPPRVAIRFAELHGALDDVDGRPRADLYALLAERDRHFPLRKVTTKAWDPKQDAAEAPKGDDVVIEFAEAVPGQPAPYLPDPLAGGVALKIVGVPDVDPDALHFIPFYGDEWDESAVLNWPDALLFAVRAGTAGDLGWDRAKRQFVIPLAPGERARIRMSALLPKVAQDQMALLRMLRTKRPEAYAQLLKAIRHGQHWMFTPWRTLELVHATQRPLVKPAFLRLSGGRALSETRGIIGLSTPVHAKSTVRIDVDATWQEIEDDDSNGPRVRSLVGPAFTIPLHRSAFPEGEIKDGGGIHPLPDNRARRIGYRMVATTRFREFMPFDIRSDAASLTEESARDHVWVPSSSPPPAPAIRYVVPTFGWMTSNQGKRVWRRGGGLRVWLDRPWFGSGANEMLAVLLPRGNADPQRSDAKNYVTQWGSDPAWPDRSIASTAPPRSAFSRAVNAGPVPLLFTPAEDSPDPAPDAANPPPDYPVVALRPQGAPADFRVDAVPHAVGYDADRKLWYCDIVINPGEAYFPFIRLALARYQPASLPDMHLSSVATASFQQLAPDRVATVIPLPGRIRVEVCGHGDPPVFAVPNMGQIDIRLQRLKPGKDESLDWQDTPEGERPATPSEDGRDIVDVRRNAPGKPSRLTKELRLRIDTARHALEAGDLSVLDTDPGIVDHLLPPLLRDQLLWLPPRGPDRLRVLVTEREVHATMQADAQALGGVDTRIVYATAIEI